MVQEGEALRGDGVQDVPAPAHAPTSTFYGQSGNTIKTFKPFSGKRDRSWSPVWSIRNC